MKKTNNIVWGYNLIKKKNIKDSDKKTKLIRG